LIIGLLKRRRFIMAGLYFPKNENLTPFTEGQMRAVEAAVGLLREAVLPNEWKADLDGLRFFADAGMTVDNGVMGYTSYLKPKEILIAGYLVEQLAWGKPGAPNNEMPMATIVHELTHTAQRGWLFGLLWLVLNIPGIDRLTLEKWAVENQEKAEGFLWDRYREMRKVTTHP
jgi:hypothetical protein